VSAIRHSAKPGFFLKKTLKIFAESQADKALGKDYTLPSANPRTLGKGIFFKKLFYFLSLFLNRFFQICSNTL